MVSVIRQNTITNATAALIPSGSPLIICNAGQDYGFEAIDRTIIAQEIGVGAGQTQDAASNPTTGLLFAQFQGAEIRRVVSVALVKSSAATNVTVFQRFAWAVGAGTSSANIGFAIANPSDPTTTAGWNKNYASLFLLDTGGLTSAIAAGDIVRVLVELGSPKY